MPDLPLVAIGVAIWIVAMSVAFGFYLPVLRAERRAGGRLLRGFASSRRINGIAAYRPARPAWTGEDLDHAAMPASAPSVTEPAAPPAVSEPISEPPVAPVLVAGPEPSPTAAADCARPEAFSVLIVDDNAINRQVLELILDSVGIAHASVENGLEAVEAMTACAHDAILMDLQMPVMDGFEATRRIRALEARRGGSPARIIVVSANCLDEHVVASRQAGADAHLAKPISAGALIGQVEDCATIARLAA
jgi:CheY-like chemotaxis protein